MANPGVLRTILDIPVLPTRHGALRVENLPYLLFHLIPLAAFFVPFQWSLVWLAVGLYVVRMFAVTGFYHRYFSHRGYRVRNRVVQFLMAFAGATALQQGPLWWANHHRHHHRHSDTEQDVHSPIRSGFWYSHTLWFLLIHQREELTGRGHDKPADLAKFPELVWLDRYHLVAPALLGVVLYAIGGLPYLVWGGISTVVLWHGTFTINSLSHVLGRRRFETGDTSRNNLWLALITLGEGWHNNHHAFCGGAHAGFYWYEIDITYYGLWIMSKLGLISDLGAPPRAILEQGRENDSLRRRARRVVRAGIARKLSAAEVGLLLEAAGSFIERERRALTRLSLNEVRHLVERYRATRNILPDLGSGAQSI
jgi:stearoyl-CoA desaturase (delta-9 desaturase)